MLLVLSLAFSLTVFAGNVTTFGRKVLTYFKQNPQYHIGLLAETHLSRAMADDEEVRLQKLGMRGIHAHGQTGHDLARQDPQGPSGPRPRDLGSHVWGRSHGHVGDHAA